MLKFKNNDDTPYGVKVIFTDGKERQFYNVVKTDFSNGFVMFDFDKCYCFINTDFILDITMSRKEDK